MEDLIKLETWQKTWFYNKNNPSWSEKLGQLSTHEFGAFRKRSSNQWNLKTPFWKRSFSETTWFPGTQIQNDHAVTVSFLNFSDRKYLMCFLEWNLLVFNFLWRSEDGPKQTFSKLDKYLSFTFNFQIWEQLKMHSSNYSTRQVIYYNVLSFRVQCWISLNIT